MRKLLLPASLLFILLFTYSSIAFSFYRESAKKTPSVLEAQTSKCLKTDETIWESLTKKMVGMVSVHFEGS
jgi:hypothetical protein